MPPASRRPSPSDRPRSNRFRKRCKRVTHHQARQGCGHIIKSGRISGWPFARFEAAWAAGWVGRHRDNQRPGFSVCRMCVESGIAVSLCLIVVVVRREVCMIDTYLTRPPFLFGCSGARPQWSSNNLKCVPRAREPGAGLRASIFAHICSSLARGSGFFPPPYFQRRYGGDPVNEPDTRVLISQRTAVSSGPRLRAAGEFMSSSGAQAEAGSPGRQPCRPWTEGERV